MFLFFSSIHSFFICALLIQEFSYSVLPDFPHFPTFSGATLFRNNLRTHRKLMSSSASFVTFLALSHPASVPPSPLYLPFFLPPFYLYFPPFFSPQLPLFFPPLFFSFFVTSYVSPLLFNFLFPPLFLCFSLSLSPFILHSLFLSSSLSLLSLYLSSSLH